MLRKTKNNKPKGSNKAKFVLAGAICGALAISTIVLSINCSTNGAEIARLQKEKKELLSVQEELQKSLVTSLSVSSLNTQVEGLGFVKISNLVYVNTTAKEVGSVINSNPTSYARLP